MSCGCIFVGAANKVEAFFSPANLFIQRWLPLFYVPSLVVVPLSVKGIPAVEGAKIGAILGTVYYLPVGFYMLDNLLIRYFLLFLLQPLRSSTLRLIIQRNCP